MKKIISEISRVCNKLKIEPYQLSTASFLKEANGITPWDLRKHGGFKSIILAHFPDERDMQSVVTTQKRVQYVRKLEREVGLRKSFEQAFYKRISQVISTQKLNVVNYDKQAVSTYLNSIKSTDNSDTEHRSVCTIWSDQHFGMKIDPEAVGQINQFNWSIGARRLGLLCEQLATYKIEKRHLHDELVIFLLGDNIAGIIHNQEGPDIDLITFQVSGTLSYYVQALSYLKNFYKKIRVECQPGNHGRMMHKSSKDRALQQKYDSFENIIFYALSEVFRKDPVVRIRVEKTPYSDVIVQGHRIMATHGDTVFDVGNVGNVVHLAKIEKQVSKINAERLNSNQRPFEMFCTGHVHHPLFTHVGSGIKIIINGCLIGTDEFALAIGIPSSQPVQVLWETTKAYVQGDVRSVYVSSADQEERYEDIIRPYNYQLTTNW